MMEDVYEKVKDIIDCVWHREMSADEGMDELTCVVDLFPAQWQDISTAPKDGTAILVYDPDELFPFAATWDGECDVWVDAAEDSMVEPTLWMSLPAPPNL